MPFFPQTEIFINTSTFLKLTKMRGKMEEDSEEEEPFDEIIDELDLDD